MGNKYRGLERLAPRTCRALGAFISLQVDSWSFLAFAMPHQFLAFFKWSDNAGMKRVIIGALLGAAVGFVLGSMVLTVSPEFEILGSVAGTILGAIAGDLDRRRGR